MEDAWPVIVSCLQPLCAFFFFWAAARTERCPGPRVLVVAAHCAVSALAQPSLLLEDTVGLMACSKTWSPFHILQTEFLISYFKRPVGFTLQSKLASPHPEEQPCRSQRWSQLHFVATNLQFHSDIFAAKKMPQSLRSCPRVGNQRLGRLASLERTRGCCWRETLLLAALGDSSLLRNMMLRIKETPGTVEEA